MAITLAPPQKCPVESFSLWHFCGSSFGRPFGIREWGPFQGVACMTPYFSGLRAKCEGGKEGKIMQEQWVMNREESENKNLVKMEIV